MVCVHASRRQSRHPERFEMQQAIRECNLGPDAFERLAELGCRVLAVA